MNISSLQTSELHNMVVEETNIEDIYSISETELQVQVSPPKKCTKHKTTYEEEQVLNQLEDYKDSLVLPTEFAKRLVEQLVNVEQSLELPAYWTLTKVQHRWYYCYKKSKKVYIKNYFNILEHF